MKVILLSRWSNLGLPITIRKDTMVDFIKLLNSGNDSAFHAIMNDVDYFHQGLDPNFISKYTARRISTFFPAGNSNYFNRLIYANR